MSNIFLILVVIILPVAFITIMVGSLVRDYIKLKRELDQETLEAIETLETMEKDITEAIQLIDTVEPEAKIIESLIKQKKAIRMAIRKLKEE